MILENTVEDQMFSPMCILRKPTTWIAVLVAVFICYGFSGYRCLFLLITSLVLISSTVFFHFSKRKPILVGKPVKDETLNSDKKFPPQVEESAHGKNSLSGSSCKAMYTDLSQIPQRQKSHALDTLKVEEEEDEEESKLKPESDNSVTAIREGEEKGMVESHDCSVRSPDFSETECIDDSTSSEDSDVDWLNSGNVGQNTDCSDNSISDEEGLIEIALPSGNYVGPKERNPKFNLQQKFPGFSAETVFEQDGLMELFAEMNEEENLIEIDISMGSIKCSRFEIEA